MTTGVEGTQERWGELGYSLHFKELFTKKERTCIRDSSLQGFSHSLCRCLLRQPHAVDSCYPLTCSVILLLSGPFIQQNFTYHSQCPWHWGKGGEADQIKELRAWHKRTQLCNLQSTFNNLLSHPPKNCLE